MPLWDSADGGAGAAIYGYPPSAFYFRVVFGKPSEGLDTSFQEVTGIKSELTIEEVIEGGENRFVHQLPKGVKQSKLVLRRGIANQQSPLVQWCQTILEGTLSESFEPKLVYVHLLNPTGTPVRSWSFANAYPVSWEVESFESSKNQVAIEKIELSYNYSKREL